MSYDLFFSADGSDAPDVRELTDYFRSRAWYDIEDDAARYRDGDTGVHFAFLWSFDDSGEKVEKVTFTINYARPRFFALEAADELDDFVDTFDFEFSDPQSEETVAAYDRDRFLREWNHGNKAAVEAISEQDEGAAFEFSLSADELRRSWEWNRARGDLQTSLGGAVFVPRVLLFARNGSVECGIVWPDAIPLVLPDVDFVLVSVPQDDSEGPPKATLVEYDDFVAAVGDAGEFREEPVPHTLLTWNEAPLDLIEELTDVGTIAEPDALTGVPVDSVLDEDILE